jgi:predicted phage terminase large subunit-like protein
MYGGAAGGGKSDALLMAAAQYVHLPGYAALLLRATFRDLQQPNALIPRSKAWWSGKAQWHSKDMRWTFPSGATITFGYLERDDDVYQYQGAELQFIGIDELTQHSEWRYRYLFSRLRKPVDGHLANVPLRIRSGSNPGGAGHEWVYKRFIDQRTRAPGAVFLPALLQDNPSLDREQYLASLAHLDPITRKQLEEGDWNAIAGGRFKKEWLRYYERIGTTFKLGERMYPIEKVRTWFLTVDPAASVKETAKDDPDYTVISAWGYTSDGHLLWLGCDRARLEIPDIPPRMHTNYLRHRAQKAFVEGGGMQKGVGQSARRFMPPMNVVIVSADKDKLVKATPFLNMAEAGRVWLPAPGVQPGFPLEDVESELLRFTGDPKQSGHDDIVDAAGIAGRVVTNRLAGPSQAPQVLR